MTDKDRLWALVSECLRRRAGGEDCSPEALVAANGVEHLLNDLRARVAEAALLPDLPGYEFVGYLGGGTFGEVYLARQTNLGRSEAVKLLHRHQVSDDTVRRFVAEGKAMAGIDCRNVVRIYTCGTHDGRPYISMAYMSGGTLADRLAAGPPPLAAAARWAAKLAAALQKIHRAGVVHRDLKPANILFDEAEEPHVADFGLARRLDGSDTLGRVGSPAYMAPEQADGRPGVDSAADVYALGVILYRLLTGRLPFTSDSPAELMDHVLHKEPPPLGGAVPTVLAELCMACLAKKPSRRPTAEQFAERLDAWRTHTPDAPPAGPPARRSRLAVVGACAAALVAGLPVAWFATPGAPPAPPPAAVAPAAGDPADLFTGGTRGFWYDFGVAANNRTATGRQAGDGDFVARVLDNGPGGYSAEQPDKGRCPLLVADATTGRLALQADRADALPVPALDGFLDAATSFTFGMVWRPTDFADNHIYFEQARPDDEPRVHLLGVGSQLAVDYNPDGVLSGNARYSGQFRVLPAGVASAVLFEIDAVNRTVAVSANGSAFLPKTVVTGPARPFEPGGKNSQLLRNTRGRISLMFCHKNALMTSAQRSAWFAAVKARYGLTAY